MLMVGNLCFLIPRRGRGRFGPKCYLYEKPHQTIKIKQMLKTIKIFHGQKSNLLLVVLTLTRNFRKRPKRFYVFLHQIFKGCNFKTNGALELFQFSIFYSTTLIFRQMARVLCTSIFIMLWIIGGGRLSQLSCPSTLSQSLILSLSLSLSERQRLLSYNYSVGISTRSSGPFSLSRTHTRTHTHPHPLSLSLSLSFLPLFRFVKWTCYKEIKTFKCDSRLKYQRVFTKTIQTEHCK